MDVLLQIQMLSFLVLGRCIGISALVREHAQFLLSWFRFRNNLLIMPFFVVKLGDSGHVVCYEMDDIERQLGFGRNSMVNFLYFCWSASTLQAL